MKKKKGGKATIVKDVMAQGFTARKAQQALNAVLDLMKFAVWCGEPVEIPGGHIQSKIRQGKPRGELQKFRDVQNGELAVRLVRYPGRRRVVTFTADLALNLTPLPPRPLPETSEQVEARQLASELLGKAADKSIMATLQQAVEVHPFMPGALLRRLRDIKSRGWQVGDIYSLAQRVASHYWL